MGDYSYYTFEDGRLRTRGLHHHDFSLLLWDTLVQTGNGNEVPEYYGRLFEEHDLQRCEVYINIPSHHVFSDGSPWSMWAIRNDMDESMVKAAHMVLTALCSQNMPATAGTPISLYPIHDRSDPEWKARMDEASNVFQDHHHSGWSYMASYAQHLLQLQHNTQCIIAGQQYHLGSYAKDVKSLSQEISHMAQEYGAVRQQVRDLESHLRDKYKKLLTIYHRSTERDQELLRHRNFCRRQRRPPLLRPVSLRSYRL
jgi:hypothetical protein